MSAAWPSVPIGDLLRRSERTIAIDAETTYREVTVRLNGKGVVERRQLQGVEIASDRRYEASAGQFIISRIDARNGASGLVPDGLDGAVVTNDFPLFDVTKERLDPSFLQWLSKTASFVDLCRRASEGTTNRVRLSEERFKALEIPLPPIGEQRRIVVKLDALAGHVAEALRLRQKVIDETALLVGAKASLMFRAAMAAGSVPLDSIAILERGKFHHRPRNEPRFFGGAHPWIQIGEIESSKKYIRGWTQTLNDDGLAISKKFPRGTVLISIAATIGAVGILDFDCCVPDSIVGVTPKPGIESVFLYHYLRYLRGHLEEVAPQSAQKNINLGILAALPVPNLSLPEQRSIVTALDGLQAQVDVLRHLQAETAEELNAMMPAILDKAFKGEL